MKIEIIKLQSKNIAEAKRLAELVIQDNFQVEGVINKFKKYLLKEVLRVQKKFAQNQSENYYFLIAKADNKILGTAGYSLKVAEPITLVLDQLHLADKSVVELISFYIHPQYQGKGIGSRLLQALFTHLKQTNYQYFSLHTGYQKAKNFWIRKIGEPTVILPKYFAGIRDCNVWVKPI